MPYSGISDADLPAAVKRLPKRLREIWVAVFNDAYDPEDEGKAFRAAWAAARNAQKQKEAGAMGQTFRSFAELGAAVLAGVEEPATAAKATKTDGGKVYTAAAYLYVPDEEKPSTWKLKIEESPGEITVAQLGRAAAALSPAGFMGQRVEMTPDERSMAARKLIALYRDQDVTDADIPEYLFEMAGMDDAEDAAEGESEDTEEKAGRAFVAFKAFEQADGRTRWVGISSGGFEDRDAEVVSTAFLDSCVEQANKSGQRGPLYVWHVAGSSIGSCDTQVVVGQPGFLVESGLFDDTDDGRRAAVYYREHAKEMGMSIKFLFSNRTEDGVYLPPGMIIERSVLPRTRAAFPWSGLTLKEASEMAKASKEAVEELARVLGEERAAEIVGDLETGAKSLQALGVRWKDTSGEAEVATEAVEETAETPAAEAAPAAEAVEEETPETDETEKAADVVATPAPELPAEMSLVLDEAALSEIAKQAAGVVNAQLSDLLTAQIGALTERLETLHAAVAKQSADIADLRRGDDERIAEKVANLPRATIRAAITRPVQEAREEAKAAAGENQQPLAEVGKRALYG